MFNRDVEREMICAQCPNKTPIDLTVGSNVDSIQFHRATMVAGPAVEIEDER